MSNKNTSAKSNRADYWARTADKADTDFFLDPCKLETTAHLLNIAILLSFYKNLFYVNLQQTKLYCIEYFKILLHYPILYPVACSWILGFSFHLVRVLC